ncbi:MAG: serine hydrolase [Anaerolineae bacterium]|jgi:hypothetical protein|nr:serine hydrolase [Anaerolineae bacterium]
MQKKLLLLLLLSSIVRVMAACQPAPIPPAVMTALTATPTIEPIDNAAGTSTPDTTENQTPTPTVAPDHTPTATMQPAPTSILTDAQLARLVEAAAAYISPDPASADQTVKEMGYASGADASLTCGPLAIAILQDAGLLSPYLPLNDFWLASPRPDRNEPIFKEAFPEDQYEWKRDTTPMVEMDFMADPLLPGDFVYTFGGNYEHMFTVTRVDEAGRAYTVQNLEQGYLNDDPNDTSFVIQETLLYDPNEPGVGMVYEWADDFNWKLGHTGTHGYQRFRPIAAITPPTSEQIELAAQIDTVIESTGGKWNILIETLDGEEIYARRPDERIHPASTIKIAVAMMTFEFLDQYTEGPLEKELQRGPIYNIMENDRSYEQLLRSMLVFSEEDAADILYENIHEGPLNEYKLLAEWGLENTSLEPRRSTAREMNAIYRGLYQEEWVSPTERQMILDWLAAYTANDDLRLGRMNELSAEKIFVVNKRGSLFTPQLIVADSGIAILNNEVYLLQFYAYHDDRHPATYEELEAALGELGLIVGAWLLDQTASSP